MLWSFVTSLITNLKPKTQSIEQKTEVYLAKRACDGLNVAATVRCKATNCLNDGAMCRDRYSSNDDFSTTYCKLTARNYNNSYSQFRKLTFKCSKRKEFCYNQCLGDLSELVIRSIVKMLSDLVKFCKLSKAYVLVALMLVCCGNVCARPNISSATADGSTRSTNEVRKFCVILFSSSKELSVKYANSFL